MVRDGAKRTGLRCGAALCALLLAVLRSTAPLRSTTFLGPSSTGHGGLRRTATCAPLRAVNGERALQAGDVVTVVGASGNVGKLATLRLTDEDYRVRAVVRSPAARDGLARFLGEGRSGRVEFFEADTVRAPEGLDDALLGAAAVVVCTGTTAFPTKAWAGGGVGEGEVSSAVWQAWSGNGFDVRRGLDALTAEGLNTPDAVDARGVEAVAASAGRAAAAGASSGQPFKRFLLMSSIGVERRTAFPFVVLNAAGVLDAKARGEAAVRACAEREGFSWTIVRPGQLFGGPYDNNYYLGTLFQLDKDAATRAVSLQRGDEAAGDTLRSSLAEVLVQTLASPATHNIDFTAISVEGSAPNADDIQRQMSEVSQ
mmetsp:Transcript_67943/g.189784  ORF Transcript_67943/g.189784 Transcript_67943/m.189784 type:complete len:370 (+) Transcript_67943:67-1176(+)